MTELKKTRDLSYIIKEYKIEKKAINFNFKEASKQLLKEYDNNNNRYNHYIHYYPGRIYPYIPFYILSLQDFSHLGGYLLDPFAGSGTILLESIMNPFVKRNALGVEINPLARLISKVKTTPIDLTKAKELIYDLKVLYSQRTGISEYIPEYKNINLWFSSASIKKLSKLKYAIDNLDAPIKYKDFFWLCFSSIIRKVSKADPYIPPPVILKPEKYKDNPTKYRKLKQHLEEAENPNVWNTFKKSVNDNVIKLNCIFEKIINGGIKAEIIWDDARNIKKAKLNKRGKFNKNIVEELAPNSVDIIFTSPPYLTAQKYIRTSKLELLWLEHDKEEINNLDKMSVGTERVSSQMDIRELGVISIDTLVKNTISKSKSRGLTVYLYFKDMLKVFEELNRILKREGYLILVVGDNKVLGEWISTYKLLSDAATNKGFKEILMLKDKIRNRSMMTKRNGSGGLIKEEYVIILKKEA